MTVIVDDRIRRFFGYWLEKREGRKIPSRASIDPLEFGYVLGDVALIDAKRETAGAARWRFRYRLVGTNIVTHDGYDLTGKTLEDLPEPEYREQIRATWTAVCETGEPAHRLRDFELDGRTRRYEVVVFPLASNGEDVDMLVSVQRHLRSS
ncbi:MAG: PAS domain-containing protein [Acidobacteriota bacterium]